MMKSRSRVLLSCAGGAVAGLVVAVGLGVAMLVSTGLNLGLVLGIDGVARSVTSSLPAIVPGLLVTAVAALLYASRDIWWVPRVGRVTAALIVLLVILVGSLQFDDFYLRNIGVVPWWDIVAIASSQSILSYAFLGIVIASLIEEAGAPARPTHLLEEPPTSNI